MNEQQNETIIRRVFDAFGRGDIQTILDACTPDSEFNSPGPAVIPYAGIRQGRAEIARYFEMLGGTQSHQKLTIQKYVSRGDTVVAIGHYTATVKSTGKTIDSSVVLVFTMAGGQIAKHLVLGDTAAAAAAYTASIAAAS